MARLVLSRFALAALIALGAGAPAPSAHPADPAAEEDGSAPWRHIVQPGDTLSALAVRYRVTVGALAAANDLRPPYTIRVGQSLRLPPGATVPVRTYVVQPGETLSAIAARFGTTVRALAVMSDLGDPDHVRPGQVVRVVADELVPRRPRSRISTGPPLLAPVRGEVVAGFGEGGGIEIAAPPRAPVRAAAAGVVAYAGATPGGTSAVVLLRHDDGGIGVYADAGEVLVARGDRIRRGAVIARLPDRPGSRLRFELREEGQKVDPTARLTDRWPEEPGGSAAARRVASSAPETQPAARLQPAAAAGRPVPRR